MKKRFLWLAVLLLNLWLEVDVSGAATVSQSLLSAKQSSESKGYIFLANHDEIVAQAKKEAKLHVLTSTDQDVLRASAAAFKKSIHSSTFVAKKWLALKFTNACFRS
jgi:hypothetical protein